MRHWIALAALTLPLSLPPPPVAAPDAGRLVCVEGSTKKVCQLTGDVDRSLGTATRSQTGKRFGVDGTDLGSSFEHGGRLFFLFGDTWGRPGARDALAWTTSDNPGRICLDFHRADDGKWLPLDVPGIRLGPFEIPSGGVSVGGKMYVVFTTDWSDARGIMGRSVLAVSEDDGKTFRALYDLSREKFINVSFWSAGDWLYIYGSGAYRQSSVCLARVKPSEIARRRALEYFAGPDEKGAPRWSSREPEAIPLFRHDVVGEFSVAYCPPVRRYILLYNAGSPRGIMLRSAVTPWGPWSDGQIIFDPWRDNGYGWFLHVSSAFPADRRDAVSDPGREAEWGGEYGPYIMARYMTGGEGRCRLFFTMSTWNPYQVVIMQTDLTLEAPGQPPPPKTGSQ